MSTRSLLVLLSLSGLLVVGCSAAAVDEEEDTASSEEELRAGGRNPCAAVLCAPGTVCEARGRRAQCVRACTHEGNTYRVGQTFRDDCNTCTCMANGAVACTKRACPPSTCTYGGNTYTQGQSFPSTDGCNTCTCSAGGAVACTERACLSTCTYGGNTYNQGDSFPSTDGCNTCTCGSGGLVGCTKRACLCNPANEPNNKYVGNSPAQCAVIRFACEPGTTYFSNACGCGCQQPSDCPSFINCMPGPRPTNCAAERARCPYTPVAY